jgi:uncharacterized protein with PIN domain
MKFSFFADATLGKLAKWLRILGFDTLYEPDVRPESDVNQLLQERILLTRIVKNRHRSDAERVVFIVVNDVYGQLQQVVDEFAITRADIRLFSRCNQCNSAVVDVDKQLIFGQVPDYVWETHETFHMCRQCNRIFWAGSHTAKVEMVVRGLLE